MSDPAPPDDTPQQLLTAVERLLASSADIKAFVDGHYLKAPPATDRRDIALSLVQRYASTAGVAGAVAAAPGMIPGIGTAVAVAGGALVDITALLKVETELALALAHLYEFDIDRPEERRFALTLASVSTVEEKEPSAIGDAVEIESTALWNYGPRHLSKLLLTALSKLIALQVGKGLVRAVPFLGVAVGASMNLVLTRRVGERMVATVAARRDAVDAGRAAAHAHGADPDADGVVNAKVTTPRSDL